MKVVCVVHSCIHLILQFFLLLVKNDSGKIMTVTAECHQWMGDEGLPDLAWEHSLAQPSTVCTTPSFCRKRPEKVQITK
jgi:hypothetical protein